MYNLRVWEIMLGGPALNNGDRSPLRRSYVMDSPRVVVNLIKTHCFFNLKNFFKFIFRERGREGERGGERQQCVVTCLTPLTGDLAHNPGMCPNWELSQWPFGLQAGTQFSEPHQPGQNTLLY